MTRQLTGAHMLRVDQVILPIVVILFTIGRMMMMSQLGSLSKLPGTSIQLSK